MILPVRVLHVVTRSQRRGAELSALDLADELDALGHANVVVALAPGFGGTLEPRLPPIAPDGRAATRLPRQVAALARVVRREAPDVVLAHGGEPARCVALLPRRLRPPVVWQRILPLPEGATRGLRSLPLRLVARRVDAAVALTPRNGEELAELGFRGPVWQIPNSRRAARFSGIDRAVVRASLRSEVGVAEGAHLVGFVGHLVDQKRPERAVAVLRRLADRGVEAHLVVAGDGPLRAQVEAAIRQEGVAGRVTLLGTRDDVPELLTAVDVLVATSESEGIPGVMIEAAMAGCPVVTFPFDGAAQLAAGGLVVVDDGDVDAMAGEVAAILRDQGRRDELVARCARLAAELSTEAMARRYAEHLAGLVRPRRGGTAAAAERSAPASTAVRADDVGR